MSIFAKSLRTGMMAGSLTTKARVNSLLSLGSVKKGSSILIIIARETAESQTERVFPNIKRNISNFKSNLPHSRLTKAYLLKQRSAAF